MRSTLKLTVSSQVFQFGQRTSSIFLRNFAQLCKAQARRQKRWTFTVCMNEGKTLNLKASLCYLYKKNALFTRMFYKFARSSFSESKSLLTRIIIQITIRNCKRSAHAVQCRTFFPTATENMILFFSAVMLVAEENSFNFLMKYYYDKKR